MEQFDSSWMFASVDVLHRERIAPNRLAYNKSSGTLAVVVKRSRRGDDLLLSQGAIDYLPKRLDQGAGREVSPIRAAIVVLTDIDDKPVKQFSAEELRA